jgi:hypothetical protein
MTNRVLLNNIDHPNLRIDARHSAAFDAINQALVFPTEFEEVQREYPIFFRKDANGELQAVAILGLDKDENLFLDERGWNARYVPAVQQRGPFLIGFQENEVEGERRREPMILVDLDDPRISQTEGEPVFLPHGGNSPYLERVAGILRTIHQGVEVSKPMFAAFEKAGLIEPVAVEIQLSDREKYALPEFYSIGQDRLAALDGAALEDLNRTGFLRLAYFVVSSLRNVNRLIDLKNRKRASG